jgi:hypothetical protein
MTLHDLGLGGFLVPLEADNRSQFMPSIREQVWIYPDCDANYGGARSAEAHIDPLGLVTLTILDVGHFIRRHRLTQFRETMEPDFRLNFKTWPRLELNPIDLAHYLAELYRMKRPATISRLQPQGRVRVPKVIGALDRDLPTSADALPRVVGNLRG